MAFLYSDAGDNSSDANGGDVDHLHYATNIVFLMAIPLYISIVNHVCVPRMELDKANNMVKFLKKINDVVFILFIIHFCRDVFLWLESFAYAPMVVCVFILKLYLSKEFK